MTSVRQDFRGFRHATSLSMEERAAVAKAEEEAKFRELVEEEAFAAADQVRKRALAEVEEEALAAADAVRKRALAAVEEEALAAAAAVRKMAYKPEKRSTGRGKKETKDAAQADEGAWSEKAS